jgi:hypothetical protein
MCNLKPRWEPDILPVHKSFQFVISMKNLYWIRWVSILRPCLIYRLLNSPCTSGVIKAKAVPLHATEALGWGGVEEV